MDSDDRLTPGLRARQIRRPMTESIAFDETKVLAWDVPAAVSNLHRYGPGTILTIPQGVSKTVVNQLAIHGNHDGFFRTFCWWFLTIDEGVTQEHLVESQVIPAGALAWGGGQAHRGGVSFSATGFLAEPSDVSIQIHQSGNLQLTVWSDFGGLHPLTVYARIGGYTQTKLPGV